MSSNSKKWVLLSIISFGGVIIDWYTKYLASHQLQTGVPVPVIGKYLQLMLIYNTGGVFGINPKAWFPWFQVNLFFYIVSTFAILLLIIYYKGIDPKAVLTRWGIAVIMPGALGNLVDRILWPHRGVVDFLKMDLGFAPFNPWPIFNMADVYITIGIAVILLDMVLHPQRQQSAVKEMSETPPPAPKEQNSK